jgi:hypothetical protein
MVLVILHIFCQGEVVTTHKDMFDIFPKKLFLPKMLKTKKQVLLLFCFAFRRQTITTCSWD